MKIRLAETSIVRFAQHNRKINEDVSDNKYRLSADGKTIVKDGAVYGAYGVPYLDAHQGEYVDGAFVPWLHPETREVMLPASMLDDWDW